MFKLNFPPNSIFQSDGGGEFISHQVQTLFNENATHHQIYCPYTPQQNGIIERVHQHITETGLAMLFVAHIYISFWAEAFASATYVINYVPSRVLDKNILLSYFMAFYQTIII